MLLFNYFQSKAKRSYVVIEGETFVCTDAVFVHQDEYGGPYGLE